MSKNSFVYLMMLSLMTGSGALADGIIDGVVGMSHVQCRTFMAVWVPLQTDEAVAGVRWYHNDGTVQFPAVLATAGGLEDPCSSMAATAMAVEVTGASLQWCAQPFTAPVASAVNGLYVLFQLPLGSTYDHDGTGGGAGIGYSHAPGGPGAWLSLDGETWVMLHPNYKLAVEPVLVESHSEMLRLERTAEKQLAEIEAGPPLRTELLLPTPNPFNPQTTLRFNLERAERIDLSVYDLRGRKVVSLASGPYAAGPHVLTWEGRDEVGRNAASGMYFAKLAVSGLEMTQRMMLIR
jgi:hypothetical protein